MLCPQKMQIVTGIVLKTTNWNWNGFENYKLELVYIAFSQLELILDWNWTENPKWYRTLPSANNLG